MALSKLLSWRKPRQLELEEYLEKLRRKGLNKDGSPILNPVPIAPPIGYKKHPSMVEIVRDMVKGERLAQAARESGHETFEEAEDFDIDDDPSQLRSEHENVHDPSLSDLLAAGAAEKAAREKSALPSEGSSTVSPEPKKPVPPSDGRAVPEA